MDISAYGPLITGAKVRFRIPLPSFNPNDFQVKVYYIKRKDQFDKNVGAIDLVLTHQPNSTPSPWDNAQEDLWISEEIQLEPNEEYIYRFRIIRKPDKKKSRFFGDPFARDTASGTFSLLKTSNESFRWGDGENNFKVPKCEDIILYELNVAEFNNNFQGIIEKIPYLLSLGINVIELMPINSIAETSRWGYMPVFQFAPEERYGGSQKLKELIRECHNVGIAVILDVVYAHVDELFAYDVAYEAFYSLWKDSYNHQTGELAPNPLLSEHNNYGHKVDFRRRSAREFYKAVNKFWIEEYHIDGFRYDHVNGYLDKDPVDFYYDKKAGKHKAKWDNYRPSFESLQELTNTTYSLANAQRFYHSGSSASNVIQIVEDLNESKYQLSDLSKNSATGCWEKHLFEATKNMARYDCYSDKFHQSLLLYNHDWYFSGFNGFKNINNTTLSVLPIQYIESHDESRLMYLLKPKTKEDMDKRIYEEHDDTGYGFDYRLKNTKWWKAQPYAIGLLTSVGTPMLWAGQEFGENYGIPQTGYHRVRGMKPIHWDYFYSPNGDNLVSPLIQLYRNLIKIRKSHAVLRGNVNNKSFDIQNYDDKYVAYRRWDENEVVVVILNFNSSDKEIKVPIVFGLQGDWIDILDKEYNQYSPFTINVTNDNQEILIPVPNSFGRILCWTKP